MSKDEINQRHEQTRLILRAAGGRRNWTFEGPKRISPSHIEHWTIPGKGSIMVQFWAEDGGVTCYADWTLGETFSDLSMALLGELEKVTFHQTRPGVSVYRNDAWPEGVYKLFEHKHTMAQADDGFSFYNPKEIPPARAELHAMARDIAKGAK